MTRRIRVGPDVSLHVAEWATGEKGVPFLCVHGLASNCRTWAGVAARLSGLGHPVAAVDLRGHGCSDKPDDGYDFATLAADLVTVLDGLGWDRAVVVGQSTGGNLVVELASRAPGRVSGVAGVDGGAIDLQRRWPVWEDCAAALAPPHLEGTPRSALEAWLRRSHPDWSEEGIEASLANFEALDDGTVRPWLSFDRHLRILRALWEHRPSPVLARIPAPVLLVLADTGDDWAAAKREEARLAENTATGSLEVHWFSPADHDLHLQHPVELADLLHQKLSERNDRFVGTRAGQRETEGTVRRGRTRGAAVGDMATDAPRDAPRQPVVGDHVPRQHHRSGWRSRLAVRRRRRRGMP